MYYAITIDSDGRITGRHESAIALTADTFAGGAYAGQEVRPVTQTQEYRAGHVLAEYDAGGKLRPLIDRIMEGLTEVPDGYEVIDGELVQTQVPEAEAPPTLMARVAAAEEAAQNSRAEEAQAVRVVFRALAQTDVIKPADALDNAGMFPLWADHIGARAEEGSYWRHVDKLYRVNLGQAHTIQENWPPENAASLYSRVSNPAEEYPEFIQPTGEHNAYSKGDKFTYKGKRYIVIHPGIRTYTWNPETYPAGTREVT